MKKPNKDISLAYADSDGRVYDFPGLEPAFRTGNRFVRVNPDELLTLPEGSVLFSLPGRYPVFYNRRNKDFNHITRSHEGGDVTAVSSFLASGYLRTYLPAYIPDEGAPALPLWAYCGCVIIDGEFFVPAVRIDTDIRSDPAIHSNDEELKKCIEETSELYPDNRLVRQLALCSTRYRCLCARNFFLGRFEAPIPTTPGCNAGCLGCLSLQEEGSGFPSSQERLDFNPTPVEISQVILHHFGRVREAVASFGQGCEGEPLLRADDLARAVRMVREETGSGTLNLNTNGSDTEGVKALIGAGLDSIRISLNSPTEDYYTRYHRPAGYDFQDVLKSIETALGAGIFVSVNLFFMPGFTDMEAEAEALFRFLERFPVNMIQARNLNIDPDLYFSTIGFEGSGSIGIRNLLEALRIRFKGVRLGYYNPPRERW